MPAPRVSPTHHHHRRNASKIKKASEETFCKIFSTLQHLPASITKKIPVSIAPSMLAINSKHYIIRTAVSTTPSELPPYFRERKNKRKQKKSGDHFRSTYPPHTHFSVPTYQCYLIPGSIDSVDGITSYRCRGRDPTAPSPAGPRSSGRRRRSLAERLGGTPAELRPTSWPRV